MMILGEDGVSAPVYDEEFVEDKEYSDEEDDDKDDSDASSFHDSAYEQSDDEELRNFKDDKNFEFYVDPTVLDIDPTAPAADEESDDVANSDIGSLSSNSDEEVEGPKKRRKTKLPKFVDFRVETDLKNPIFRAGLRFPTAKICRRGVRNYSIINGRDIEFGKNTREKVKARCVGVSEGKCPWVFYASAVNGSQMVQLKIYCDDHTCGTIETNKHANAEWLAETYSSQLSNIHSWDMMAFKKRVVEDFHVSVSRSVVYRARAKALALSEGTYVQQYAVLRDYAEELARANEGSTVIIKSYLEADGRPRFKRIYICLGALKKGFVEGCRPVLGFDGTFIKGRHPGQLLTAVSIDGNNGMYPVAYAVVEKETYDSWQWFIKYVIADLQIVDSGRYTVISDRQKGLLDAVGELLPQCEHRFCLKHIEANYIKAGHRGLTLKLALYSIAKSTTIPWCQSEFQKLKDISPDACGWLRDIEPDSWCRAYFRPTSKCDILHNNLCEAFNKAIVDARGLPIINMLEWIRYYLMKLMAKRRADVDKWHQVVAPRIFKIVEKNKKDSAWCQAIFSDTGLYEVKTWGIWGGGSVVVNLNAATCSCRKWDITGIPCDHACAAIGSLNGNHLAYVSDCYKKEAYLKCYGPRVCPMTSQDLWPKTRWDPLLPPMYNKQPGRPKAKRTKSQHEATMQQIVNPNDNSTTEILPRYNIHTRCGICREPGHNKRKCPNRIEDGTSNKVPPQKKRKTEKSKNCTQPSSTPLKQSQTSTAESQCPPPGFSQPHHDQGPLGFTNVVSSASPAKRIKRKAGRVSISANFKSAAKNGKDIN